LNILNISFDKTGCLGPPGRLTTGRPGGGLGALAAEHVCHHGDGDDETDDNLLDER
jgi:hypothetical protein